MIKVAESQGLHQLVHCLISNWISECFNIMKKNVLVFLCEIFCSKYKILLSLIEDLIEEIVLKNFLDRGMLCPRSPTALSQEGTDVQIQTQMTKTKTNTKG